MRTPPPLAAPIPMRSQNGESPEAVAVVAERRPSACSHRKTIPPFRRDLIISLINCINFPAMQRIETLVWRFLSKFMEDLFCMDVKCSPPPLCWVAVIDGGIVGCGYAADDNTNPT